MCTVSMAVEFGMMLHVNNYILVQYVYCKQGWIRYDVGLILPALRNKANKNKRKGFCLNKTKTLNNQERFVHGRGGRDKYFWWIQKWEKGMENLIGEYKRFWSIYFSLFVQWISWNVAKKRNIYDILKISADIENNNMYISKKYTNRSQRSFRY